MSGERPRLSAFICNYNHGQFVSKAIEAILGQSCPPDEFYISDDGSTDRSVEVIERYASKGAFTRFIRHQSNQGMFPTVLELRGMCTGDYVFGCSADDYPLPGFFEKAMGMAARYPQAGLITGKMVMQDARGRRLFTLKASRWKTARYVSPKDYLKEYLEVETPGHSLGSATIYRRDAIRDVGEFRAELGPLCDTFTARAVGLRWGIIYLPDELEAVTLLPGSMSNSVLKDREIFLGYIRAMARVARSPEFLPYFPPDYVDRWEAQYSALARFVHRPVIRFIMRHSMRCLTFRPIAKFATVSEKIFRIFFERVAKNA